ncbi:hypothetical protein HYY71_03930 [Candidatus Woesearchaeota archaeon]|nr:hypothetical protein [Candidatus Woesearchaeota archaeon]
MSIKNEAKEFIVFALIALLAATAFSYALFGITGIRVVAGIVFMSLPFYIFLNRFELAEGEKSVFSILLGLTLFPSLVYILGLVVSFRLGILITFVALLGIAIAVSKYESKKP